MGKKSKKVKEKLGIKAPGPVPVVVKKESLGKPPKRIRMLVSCANQHGSYPEGTVYKVPEEISVKYAREWIDCGAAEEDNNVPFPPEKK